VSLRFELACLLTEMGRTLEAREAYLEVLAREPLAPAGIEQSGDAVARDGISDGRTDGLPGGRGAPSPAIP